MIKGQSITELQNKVFTKIISNSDIMRALVIDNENFLNATPTSAQLAILNNPASLIRQQLFPYKKVTLSTENAKTYITTTWVNFKKKSNQYQLGLVYFYIIVPVSLEKTFMGIRYNFIADKLDELFAENGIGKFEYYDRGDMDVAEGYLGHYIAFSILDFNMDGDTGG